ncbi:MAG: hypothetical protein KIT46_10720 [Anaerolineales bacterium]|nr:hypothetical protein [Anaerolineales bacterium]MCW5856506.1 hypothetical protein [Anaerolineales bacterium]
MTNYKLSPYDWEALSAYLDGALDGPDQARLQTRLANETGLNAALRQLEQTRSMLRAAPQRRRPRGFTIPAALAAKLRPATSSFGLWRLVSAAASVILVAVMAGQFLDGAATPMMATMADEAPQAYMLEMAVEESATAEDAAGAAASEIVPEEADLAMEDEALRSSPASKMPTQITLSPEQLVWGLVVVVAFSSWMAWQQWRKLPDR